MKQDKKTFAQRAKDIQSKYKRIEFDPLEQADMEQELEVLMQEQEAFRNLMGMNQQDEMACGGKMKYKDGGEFNPRKLGSQLEPLMYRTDNNSLVDNSKYANFFNPDQKLGLPLDTKTLAPMNTLSPEQITTMQQQAKDAEYNGGYNRFGNLKDSGMLPYAISGASNIAGNLLLAAMTKKNTPQINPILATPERLNLEPQAEQFRKDASVSKNVGMKNARDLGLNAGATLANMGAIGSSVDRQLADTLTKLYGQQEQFNVGTANQFASQNQDVANRANMMNTQLKSQGLQDQLGYLSGALGTIPGVMKDVRMDKADKEMRNIMKTYYKNLGGKNYQTMSDLFNDPEAFQYFVKEFNKKQGK